MKVLIITQYFWPETFRVNDLALYLKEQGHEITVLTGKPNYPQGKFYKGYSFFKKRKEVYAGITIYRALMFPRYKSKPMQLMINYFSFAFFSTVRAIFTIRGKYDVIFVHEPSPITVGIPAIIIKKILKCPIFFWVLDLWPESLSATSNIKKGLFYNLILRLTKLIYKRSDRILIASKAFKKSIQNKNVPEEKIMYFPNWAEDIFLTRSTSDKYNNLIPQGFRIMFAGNMGEAQDFETIIHAAELTKEDNNISWVFVGDGRKKAWVEEQITQRSLNNIYLAGRFPIEEMPHFFRHADVMLVSLKDKEIFSLTVPAKLQSYMAGGKAIIAMLNGEGANILRESNAGVTVKAGDAQTLAKVVRKLAKESKETIEAYEKKSSLYYKSNFDKSVVIEEFINEVNKINGNENSNYR